MNVMDEGECVRSFLDMLRRLDIYITPRSTLEGSYFFPAKGFSDEIKLHGLLRGSHD